jgi:hypothetical protein
MKLKLDKSHRTLLYKKMIKPHLQFWSIMSDEKLKNWKNCKIEQWKLFWTMILCVPGKLTCWHGHGQQNKFWTHHHKHRNNKNFRLLKYNKTVSQNNLFYKNLKMFNEINDENKNEEELTEV